MSGRAQAFDPGADSPLALHERVRASAGSGKTYRLATRYTGLLLAGERPSTILATTFTRAAAGEILLRVIRRLVEAARSGEVREALARDLRMPVSTSSVHTAIRAVVSDMGRLQIRTLDSFFASIYIGLRSAAGQPPTMLDESGVRRLREETIARVLADEQDPGSRRIGRLARDLARGRAPASVRTALRTLVETLLEMAPDLGDAAWESIHPPTRRSDDLPSDPAALAAMLAAAETSAVAGGTRILNAFRDDVARLERGEWTAILGKGILAKVLAGETRYARVEIPAGLLDASRSVLEEIERILRGILRASLAATHALLDRLDGAQHRRLAEDHAMTFAAVTRAVAGIMDGEEFSILAYRLDGRISHVLLDEFQDTSIAQFRALRRLLAEIVGDETVFRTLFVVGDAKQSIYGWRGGEPALLEAIPELLLGGGEASERIVDVSLTHSWRSAPTIIDFVNRLFTGIAGWGDAAALPVGGDHGPIVREAAATFGRRFEPHDTERRNLPGSVRILRCARSDRAALAASVIRDLHGQAPAATIGVLVRSRRGATEMLRACGPSGADLPIASHVAGDLLASPPVAVVYDLLRLAEHPDHGVAAFNVATSPIASIAGFRSAAEAADRVARRRASRRIRVEIDRAGLPDFVAAAARKAAACARLDDRQRLAELVRLAEQPVPGGAVRPVTDLLRRIETATLTDARVAPIRLMTIHGAKGLEFDAVVLPQLEDPIVRPDTFAWERDRLVGPVTRITPWLGREIRTLIPETADLHEDTARRQLVEAMSLLYVAVTRARQRLEIIVTEGAAQDGHAPTLERMVLRAVRDAGRAGDDAAAVPFESVDAGVDATIILESGDRHCLAAVPGGAMVTRPPAPCRPALPAAQAPRIMPRASAPSAHGGGGRRRPRLRDAVALRSDAALVHGTLVHAAMEAIEWLPREGDCEHLLPRERLAAIMRRAVPPADADTIDRAIMQTWQALRADPIRAIFDRARMSGTPVVHREWRFTRCVDGAMQSGSIDRLACETGADGRCVSAEIIDFKTDQLHGPAGAAAEAYAAQVRDYAEVVARASGVPMSRITRRIAFVTAGVVVDLH